GNHSEKWGQINFTLIPIIITTMKNLISVFFILLLISCASATNIEYQVPSDENYFTLQLPPYTSKNRPSFKESMELLGAKRPKRAVISIANLNDDGCYKEYSSLEPDMLDGEYKIKVGSSSETVLILALDVGHNSSCSWKVY